jgi:N-acetyl sugar amidotransferase
LVYKAGQLGLRPSVVHYDNGWNSELAVMNIENIVKRLNLDLYTVVNNWEEFKDLQRSFLKANVVDIEMLTDQAIMAVQYKVATKFNISYILGGANTATESILPKSWYHWKIDVLNILAIHKKFGQIPLKTYPTLTYFKRLYVKHFKRIQLVNLLNYMPYNKVEAKKTIMEKIGWQDYGGKHFESIFTRFYQAYILPVKFHIDKRKAHLASLICSGQMTREEALEELKKPIYDADKLIEDKEYVVKKLGMTEQEFDAYMQEPAKSHLDYPSYLTRHYKMEAAFFWLVRPINRMVKKLNPKMI